MHYLVSLLALKRGYVGLAYMCFKIVKLQCAFVDTITPVDLRVGMGVVFMETVWKAGLV